MHPRHRWSILALFALLTACGGPTQLSRGSREVPTAPMSISEAFRYALATEPGKARRVSVVAGNVPEVTRGNANLLVVPLRLDASREHKLIVRSAVARKSEQENVLFYALVSMVDAQGQITETLKPRFEFQMQGNELINEFAVPAGVDRVLVHTSEEFYDSDFTSQTSPGSGPNAAVAAGASLAGGVVGVSLLLVASQGRAAGFHFGQVGQISVTVD
jgi:hypothetical protein